MDIVHIPSQGALKLYYQQRYGGALLDDDIKALLQTGTAIATLEHINQKYSETFGDRNTAAKKALDASDLRAAVDSNFDAQAVGWREEGFSEEQIDKTRAELHKRNEARGLYEPWE